MANNTKRQVIDEPPGFSAAWDRLTSGRIGAYGGKKQAYAEFYRAGQQSRDWWIEPKPVVPRPTTRSLEAWPFAIKLEADTARQVNALRLQAAMQGGTPDERRYSVLPDRQPGENRAAHRARLKRERREANARKVPA